MTLLLLFNQPIPSTQAPEPPFSGGGVTLSVDLWIADVSNNLVTNITDSLVDGWAEVNVDRAIKLAAQFKIRNPSQVRPYIDYLAPFLRLEYDDNSPTVFQQLGLYATKVPPGTSTIEDAVGTFDGSDLTVIPATSEFADAYNIAAGTNIGTAITSILTGAGITRVNIPATTRTAAAIISFSTGTARLDAANSLAQGIGWYALGSDLDGKISTPGATRPLASVEPVKTVHDWDLFAPLETTAPGREPSNTIVAVSEDSSHAPLTSVAINADPSSPTSTVNTGRSMSPPGGPLKPQGPMTQADLDAYAARLLSESRSYYHVAKVTVAPDPNLLIAHQTLKLALTGANADKSGNWWIRVAKIGFTPSTLFPVLEINRISSDVTGAIT